MPYVANKHNMAQITNVHYWDSAANAWSGNLLGAVLPTALLPNPVLANDLVIFGIDTSVVNSGPFCSLVFDIGTAIAGVTRIDWLYSDAAGADPTTWGGLLVNLVTLLPFQDNTNASGVGTGVAFDTSGINSVHWAQPSGWIVQNPTIGGVALGVTGYWICGDVIAAVAATPPTQTNRRVYSILWPAIEVAADDIGGDIPVLTRIKLRNESGCGILACLTLQATNILVGARSTDRGENFTSYINIADEQNPAGITVAAVAPTGFVTDVQTPTGRKVEILNVAAGWNERASVQIDNTLAPEYRGLFHAFLRVDQLSGAAGDIQARLTVALYSVTSENVVFTSRVADLLSILPWDMYDLGRVQLVPDSVLDDDVFNIEIRIELSGTAGTEDIDLFDLVLIPVDEWVAEFAMGDAGNVWGLRYAAGILGTVLDVDSVTRPRWAINAFLSAFATDEIMLRPRVTGRAPVALYPNREQHLHFFSYFLTAGTSITSHYQLAGSVTMETAQRYLSMRGDR